MPPTHSARNSGSSLMFLGPSVPVSVTALTPGPPHSPASVHTARGSSGLAAWLVAWTAYTAVPGGLRLTSVYDQLLSYLPSPAQPRLTQHCPLSTGLHDDLSPWRPTACQAPGRADPPPWASLISRAFARTSSRFCSNHPGCSASTGSDSAALAKLAAEGWVLLQGGWVLPT